MTGHCSRMYVAGLGMILAWAGCSSKDYSFGGGLPDADLVTGGVVETGGMVGTGGAIAPGETGGALTGGTLAPPEAGATAGTGGTARGGSNDSAGVVRPGGAVGGATPGTGGKVGTGGGSAKGGSSGGAVTTGGKVAASGGTIMGGTTRSGGVTAAGGTTRSGGVTAPGGTGTGGTPAGGTTSSIPLPTGAPGNPDGHATIPADALLEDVSKPTTVVGTGTPESCTGDLFIAAVAKGGVITFNCGPDIAIVRLSKPAKVFNDKGPKIVIDGGGKVILSGENVTRILYMNTCDEKQVWTSTHCDNQETPQLTVQNLTFANGNAKNEDDGGGAIYASGGRFKAINSRFVNNVCADTGPDVGGGAIRVFQQYNGLPAYVVGCTLGGASGLGNVCSNGGALSSIGVSWTILNSVISYNQAIGNGGNPASANTPGGGSGGGIYNDGDKMTLTIAGTLIQYNKVNAYGSAIFFVSNNKTGNIVIDGSTITNNIGGSWYPTYPQISNHDVTPITVTNSTIK